MSGAALGMAGARPVTGDLSQGGAQAYAHLTVSGNHIR